MTRLSRHLLAVAVVVGAVAGCRPGTVPNDQVPAPPPDCRRQVVEGHVPGHLEPVLQLVCPDD